MSRSLGMRSRGRCRSRPRSLHTIQPVSLVSETALPDTASKNCENCQSTANLSCVGVLTMLFIMI